MDQPLLDSHLHLWNVDRYRYDWLSGFADLNRSFLPADRAEAIRGSAIRRSVFVECDVHESMLQQEASWACELAGDPANAIIGVIAGCRPEQSGFETHLDQIRHPKVKGVRRVLHSQPAELMTSSQFIANIRTLGMRGLTFDLCVQQSQLSAATRLVRECERTHFVLDHCGNPTSNQNDRAAWRASLAELATERNVVGCKISGLLGAVDRTREVVSQVREIVRVVVDCFGAERVLFGSDWPVCRLGGSLNEWLSLFNEVIESWTPAERALVSHDNACRIYGLDSIAP